MQKLKNAHPFLRYLLENQIIGALLLLLAGWFIIQIKEILIMIFISYIIMATLIPCVNFLRRRRMPKVVAVVISYFLVLSLLVLLIFPLIPFLVSQVQLLLLNFPTYLREAGKQLGFTVNSSQLDSFLASKLSSVSDNAFALTGSLLGGVFTILTILVISFYMLLDHDRMRSGIASFVSPSSEKAALAIVSHIENKLGAWLRGQLLLSLSVGVLTWIVLIVLGMNFALPLAVIAGILEIVPIIGPILGAIPSVIVALTISPTLTFGVIIGYTFIQTIANNILVPKVMERAVGLNPVIVIVAVTIGAKLMGIVGALVSIPLLTLLIILFNSARQIESIALTDIT